jgi:hypothetical protein
MQLRVGPFIYRVRLVRGYIDHAGQSCLGLCDNERGQLLISDRAGPSQRLQILGHEYMEAWVYHFGGQNPGKEDYCDLLGLALTQLAAGPADAMTSPASPAAGSPTDAEASEGEGPPPSTSTFHAGAQALHHQLNDASGPTAAAAEGCEDEAGSLEPTAEHTTDPEPGQPRPWRVRVYEP